MLTEIDQNLHKKVCGFVLNTGFSDDGVEKIKLAQSILVEEFGDSIWLSPPKSLHVTLMDWFAPLVQYSDTHENLFKEYRKEYEDILTNLLNNQSPIEISFNSIIATPTAIIIRGTDNGSYGRIRDEFMKKIQLQPGTKLPPKIIHSSVARFRKAVDFDLVERFTKTIDINFKENISEFRLLRESEIPMLEFAVLRSFKLKPF